MKILLFLFNAEAGQLAVSRAIEKEFISHGHFCEIKDIAHYGTSCLIINSRAKFRADKNLRTIVSRELYNEVCDNKFDAIVFIDPFPAEIYSFLRSKFNLSTPSFFIHLDYSFHAEYQSLTFDKMFLPSRFLLDDYLKLGLSSDKLTVSGIPTCEQLPSNAKHDFAQPILYVIFADKYNVDTVTEIIDTVNKKCRLQQTFAIVADSSRKYKYFSDYYQFKNDAVVFDSFENFVENKFKFTFVYISNSHSVYSTNALNCRTPLVLFDVEGGYVTEDYRYLTHEGLCIGCRNFEDLIYTIKSLNLSKDYLHILRHNMDKLVPENPSGQIVKNIISYNNRLKTTNEKR